MTSHYICAYSPSVAIQQYIVVLCTEKKKYWQFAKCREPNSLHCVWDEDFYNMEQLPPLLNWPNSFVQLFISRKRKKTKEKVQEQRGGGR